MMTIVSKGVRMPPHRDMTDRKTLGRLSLVLFVALLAVGIAAVSWPWRGGTAEPVAPAPVASEAAPTPSEPSAVASVRTEAPPPVPAEPAGDGLRVLVQDRAKRPV